MRQQAESDIESLKELMKEEGIETETTTKKDEDLANQYKYTAESAKDSSKASAKAADDTAKAEKDLTKKLEDERDKRFKDLKYNLDMGQITEEQYYQGLETLRDSYFEKGSDDYHKYSQDIYNYQKRHT